MQRLEEQLQANKIVKILEIILIFLVAFIIIKIIIKPDGDHLKYNQAVVWIASIAMLTMV